MTEQGLYRRIVRRETHQSRSTSSVIVLAIIAIGAAYVGTEITLSLLNLHPLLVSPAAAMSAYSAKTVWLPYAGLGAVIVGVILVLVALLPTRRPRHGATHERMALVVDDRVLASSLSTIARLVAGVGANRVRTSVSRRRAVIALTPTSGVPVDKERAAEAAGEALSALTLSPRIRAVSTVNPHGVVGS